MQIGNYYKFSMECYRIEVLNQRENHALNFAIVFIIFIAGLPPLAPITDLLRWSGYRKMPNSYYNYAFQDEFTHNASNNCGLLRHFLSDVLSR